MLAWRLRSLLSPGGRLRARRAADRLLWPLGSIKAAAKPGTTIALTFDDGPDEVVTSRLLDLLRVRGARATFFVLTEKASSAAHIVRRIVDEGHEVALHADRHDRFTTIRPSQLRRRLQHARRDLERLSGRRVRFVRPPFGAQSLTTFTISRIAGLDVVVWGPYGEDWIESTPEEVADRALRNLHPGDILLMHDGLERPAGEPLPSFDRVQAVALILEALDRKGLRTVTVGDLIQTGARRTAWFRP